MRSLFAAILLSAVAIPSLAIIPYERVHGLMAAVYTPFTSNGESIALEVVEAQASYLNRTGVKNVLVAGTTGESVKLTVAERRALAEEWVKVAPKYDIRIFVHVGANALADARALAAHAESLNVAGVVSMATTYFRPSTIPDLAAELTYIADGAPSTPFYYYHIPVMVYNQQGGGFDMHDFLDYVNSTGKPATLVGVKYTDYNEYPLRRSITAHEGIYDLLYGRDEQLLGAVAMGVHGAVGSTYNFAGKYANDMVDAFGGWHATGRDGNLTRAQEFQSFIDEVVAIYHDFADRDAGKAIMEELGIPVGPPRLPTPPMTDSERAQLREDLKRIGFLPSA